VVGGVAQEPSD